ncbi:hypothetical protein [Spiroplasma endosymbiont of Colias croceus]|uniref:hypothetical protein n=1 Tax=Spiroplasma endosymbiont of Colias croceus TaxID=3066310 RepID=UPI0030D06CD2
MRPKKDWYIDNDNKETFNMIGSRQLGKINYHLDNCQDNNCNDYAHAYIKQK